MQERRNAMADDKSKRDNRDRSKVAGAEDYEVRHLAERTGISSTEARDLVDRFGNDRELLLHQAQRLKKSG
jgi:VIT1/CCC1 family predicted Fe2+/Mn2+ transporter